MKATYKTLPANLLLVATGNGTSLDNSVHGGTSMRLIAFKRALTS